jgi:uncharacterized membrane protein YccC
MSMSMQSKRQIEHRVRQDEFASRIVHHLDEAIDEIPHHIEKRLAEIHTQVLQRRFGNSKTNSS